MAIRVNRIEGNLNRVSGLLDTHLKNSFSIQEILVHIFASPILFGGQCRCDKDNGDKGSRNDLFDASRAVITTKRSER